MRYSPVGDRVPTVHKRRDILIDRVDDKFVRWIESIFADPRPGVTLIDDLAKAGPGISLLLTDVALLPAPRGLTVPDVRVSCKYLIGVSTGKVTDDHRILGRILNSAAAGAVIDGDRLDLDFSDAPPAAAWWTAAGVKPRPVLVVRVRGSQPRNVPVADPVTGPLQNGGARMGVLRGIVVGFNDIPVAGATVTVPPFPATCRTDLRGRFVTGNIPITENGTTIEIRAKGITRQVLAVEGESAHVVFEELGKPSESAVKT